MNETQSPTLPTPAEPEFYLATGPLRQRLNKLLSIIHRQVPMDKLRSQDRWEVQEIEGFLKNEVKAAQLHVQFNLFDKGETCVGTSGVAGEQGPGPHDPGPVGPAGQPGPRGPEDLRQRATNQLAALGLTISLMSDEIDLNRKSYQAQRERIMGLQYGLKSLQDDSERTIDRTCLERNAAWEELKKVREQLAHEVATNVRLSQSIAAYRSVFADLGLKAKEDTNTSRPDNGQLG